MASPTRKTALALAGPAMPKLAASLIFDLEHAADALASHVQAYPAGHEECERRLVEARNALSSYVAQLAVEAPAGGKLPGCVKPDTEKQVFFYEQDFYVLSNFSAFNLVWKTSQYLSTRFETAEHAYHWEKFNHLGGRGVQEILSEARSAHEVFTLAQEHQALRRPDWDEVKVAVMKRILRAKVDQHEYVRRKLLATGDRELIEDSWRDDFWGWGPNRDGKNMLGNLWMEVRAELRAGKTIPAPGMAAQAKPIYCAKLAGPCPDGCTPGPGIVGDPCWRVRAPVEPLLPAASAAAAPQPAAAAAPADWQPAFIASILPTRIWIEDGFGGERVVVLQHEGWEPFDYAVFNYRYGYTDNNSTWGAAESTAKALGATEPIEHRRRAIAAAPQPPAPAEVLTKDEVAAILELLSKDHDGTYFEHDCPSCTAYRKLNAGKTIVATGAAVSAGPAA